MSKQTAFKRLVEGSSPSGRAQETARFLAVFLFLAHLSDGVPICSHTIPTPCTKITPGESAEHWEDSQRHECVGPGWMQIHVRVLLVHGEEAKEVQ